MSSDSTPISYPWFRTYSEMLEDPKMLDMTDSEWGMWIKVLCLANKQPTRGKITLKSDKKSAIKQLASILRSRSDYLATFLKRASDKNMVDYEFSGNTGYLEVTNWDKRQFSSDSSTARTREWRKRKRHSDRPDTDKETNIYKDRATLDSLEKELDKFTKEMAEHWEKAPAFANAMRKENFHPGAIMEALIEITKSKPTDPWAYARAVVKSRSPTLCEQDHHLTRGRAKLST